MSLPRTFLSYGDAPNHASKITAFIWEEDDGWVWTPTYEYPSQKPNKLYRLEETDIDPDPHYQQWILNYSERPTHPCANCEAGIVDMDYLCGDCRD